MYICINFFFSFFFFSVGQILSLSSHFHSCLFHLCICLPIAAEPPQHQYAGDCCWSLARIRINDIWQRETLTKTLFFLLPIQENWRRTTQNMAAKQHKRRRRRCDSRKRSPWSKRCSRHSWHEQTNGQAKTASYSQCCYCATRQNRTHDSATTSQKWHSQRNSNELNPAMNVARRFVQMFPGTCFSRLTGRNVRNLRHSAGSHLI